MLRTTTSTWRNLDDDLTNDDLCTLEPSPLLQRFSLCVNSLIALLADDLLRLHLVRPAIDQRLVLAQLADLVLPSLLLPVAKPRLFRDDSGSLALVRDDDPRVVPCVDLAEAREVALALLRVGVERQPAKVGRRVMAGTGLVEGARVPAVRTQDNVWRQFVPTPKL